MATNSFGAGSCFATPRQDASGNSISNPTPVRLFDMQEVDVDLSADTKELYGENQFPIAIGAGKKKMEIKVKTARISAAAWNTLFFGQTLVTGLINNNVDRVGAAIPTTPFTITPTVPNSGTWSADLGVVDGSGIIYTRVASAPATGQYSVAAGVYTFAAADTGKTVYISFQYTNTQAQVANSQKQTVANLPMGYVPTFRLDFNAQYQGKVILLSFPWVVPGKFSMKFKNEDFMIPELTFNAAADPTTGAPMTWSLSE